MREASRRFVIAAGLGASLVPLSRAAAQMRTVRLVALGDSLTAGYLLPADAAFPVVLQKALETRGLSVEVANAGVSGDTTAGGLARLDWSVPEGTDGVILELGANDALRGLDPTRAEANLDAILTRLKARNVSVFLAGMLAPRNNGAEYVAAFDGMYPRLAAKHGVALYPFFTDGVTGVPSLLLSDALHPNREGVAEIVKRILPMVEVFVRQIEQGKGPAKAG